MIDHPGSLHRPSLINSDAPDTPSLNHNRLSPRLEPLLLPSSKSAVAQVINPHRPRMNPQERHGSDKEGECRPASRKHQFHFWLGKKDFLFLQDQAQEEGESVARIIRKLIRQFRINSEGGTTARR
jgi:hypothetical protein